MASPQKENGFTSIANEILEEVPKRKFNGTQMKIIMVIWRYTYGFQRKSHEFSLSFLIDNTGASKDSIKKELKNLTQKKVLIVVKEATFNQPREIAFNKNYDEWEVPKNDFTSQSYKNNTGGEKSSPTGGQSSPSGGGEKSSPTGGQSSPYIKKEKENIKEKDKEKCRKSKTYDENSVYYRLASRLYENILKNNPDHKKPNLQKWADDVRLMIERDNRAEDQIRYLIDWAQQNTFWKTNILSIAKLREKFDQLVMQVKAESERQKQRDGPKLSRAYQSLLDWAAEEETL